MRPPIAIIGGSGVKSIIKGEKINSSPTNRAVAGGSRDCAGAKSLGEKRDWKFHFVESVKNRFLPRHARVFTRALEGLRSSIVRS